MCAHNVKKAIVKYVKKNFDEQKFRLVDQFTNSLDEEEFEDFDENFTLNNLDYIKSHYNVENDEHCCDFAVYVLKDNKVVVAKDHKEQQLKAVSKYVTTFYDLVFNADYIAEEADFAAL